MTLATTIEAIKRIVAQHDFLYKTFEEELRNVIAGSDLLVLITGSISRSVIINSLSASLQKTAEIALTRYEDTKELQFFSIAQQLWNPLVANLLQTLTIDPKEQSVPMTSKHLQPKQVVKKVSRNTLKTTVLAPTLAATDLLLLRDKLKAVALTKPHLYSTSAHTHIQCGTVKCEFCTDLFHTVNLTKCEGHKPCCNAGWYPHIGKALWSMVRSNHSKGLACRMTPKACKKTELPCIKILEGTAPDCDNMSVTPTNNSRASSVRSVPVRNVKSPIIYPRQRLPSESESMVSETTLDWAQSVEDQWHTVHKRKRTDPHADGAKV